MADLGLLVGLSGGAGAIYEVAAAGTFRADVGAGLDFGEFGVFVAKAISDDEPPNFLFRIGHRF